MVEKNCYIERVKGGKKEYLNDNTHDWGTYWSDGKPKLAMGTAEAKKNFCEQYAMYNAYRKTYTYNIIDVVTGSIVHTIDWRER